MVKTHKQSRFSLLTLDQIRDSSDVILQIQETDSTFTESKKSVYLCEVIKRYEYQPANLNTVSTELVRVNKERDRLQRKTERLEKANRDLKNLITPMKTEAEK